MTNPLIQLPGGTAAIHILITKPGAISGTEAQREEIAASLPKPEIGKHWAYQALAAYPLRFATIHDADAFMEAMAKKETTDRYFVAPMLYDGKTNKWHTNIAYNKAEAELVVYVQVDTPVGERDSVEAPK